LDVLQENGWKPAGSTVRWDLERSPFRILTATERVGPRYYHILARIQYPPGQRDDILEAMDLAAADAGLDRLD
ncbi:MAG: hypothetical protein HKO57_07300, partial [Akkermansiaceae bacterium]|nr:hypothetical protein [Akkermansiaceae bacterium]